MKILMCMSFLWAYVQLAHAMMCNPHCAAGVNFEVASDAADGACVVMLLVGVVGVHV